MKLSLKFFAALIECLKLEFAEVSPIFRAKIELLAS